MLGIVRVLSAPSRLAGAARRPPRARRGPTGAARWKAPVNALGGSLGEPAGGGESSLVRATLWALLTRRRLIPILVVVAPTLAAQAFLSRDHDPLGLPLAAALCAAIALVAPVAFRVLFPDGLDFGHGAIRVLMYGALSSGVVLVIGAVLPKLASMGDTFLTGRSGLIACGALFMLGGWGLGRDIELEDRLRRERARSAVLLRDAERAQLLALRSHLDPHFLFNTLNAIAEWCREDGEVAERAVLQLSSMLRTVLAGVRTPSWPVSDELQLVRTLLSLHLLRDPERFGWRIDAPPEVLGIQVPPMVLLPLAENAVKHGPATGASGDIELVLGLDGDALQVRLSSPGPYRGPRRGSEGLPTLEKRLALCYDGRASLAIAGEGPRTVVRLRLPRSGPVDAIGGRRGEPAPEPAALARR